MKKKTVTVRYLKPIQYMTIKFQRGSGKDSVIRGEIKVQLWLSGIQHGISVSFRPTGYLDAYDRACEGLAAIMEYPCIPKYWIKARPSLDEAMRQCKIEIIADRFVREEEEAEA